MQPLLPQTLGAWGLIAVIASFALLVLGAVVSWQKPFAPEARVANPRKGGAARS